MKTAEPLTPLPYQILSNVKTRPINWLWKPYIPRGAMTMIVGDGGYGKSWMTCAIAADLSSGRALPGQEPLAPQRVLMISAEDGVSQIIKPKMEVLAADMSRIAAIDEGFSLNPRIVERISLAVKEFDVAVVFFDPMVTYLGGGVDMFKANETRVVLAQLDAIAKANDIAVVGVHHVKKAAGAIAQHKSLGSVDFVNGVRSTLLVDISKTGQYYMSHVKANWIKKGPSLAYDFTGDRFMWQGEYDTSGFEAHELSMTPRGKAKAFLVHVLRDGAVHAIDVLLMGKEEGLSERTLDRAKKGVARSFQRNAKWYWELCPGLEPHPEVIGSTPKALVHALEKQAPTFKINQQTMPQTDLLMERLVAEAKARMGGANGQDA
jgi:DNA repair protein RadA/Sms